VEVSVRRCPRCLEWAINQLATVTNPIPLPPSSYSQPIPVDTNGDMKIDLLGMTPASRSNSNAPLMLWKNVWNSADQVSPIFDV
jgi:integrin alpha FG-GAP repeat containing protein 1